MIQYLPKIEEINVEDVFCLIAKIDTEIDALDAEEFKYLGMNKNKIDGSSIIVDCVADKVALMCYKLSIFRKFNVQPYNTRDFF